MEIMTAKDPVLFSPAQTSSEFSHVSTAGGKLHVLCNFTCVGCVLTE